VCAALNVGILGRQGPLNAVVPGSLVHIVDLLSHRRFLVDTVASHSIFPHHSSAVPSGPKLWGAAGQLILCWGEKTMTLSFHGQQFSWAFLLAAVSFPIIGVDFLCHFKLMVDPVANAQMDKCSIKHFATISALTAAASVDSGPPLTTQPAVTSQRSLVTNHQSLPSSSSEPTVTAADVKVPTGLSAATLSAGVGFSPTSTQVGSFEKLLAEFPAVVNASKVLPRCPSGDL
jgi:hypothetical protein